ncbi:MAG: hypothetical protein V3U15_05390 [Nitrospinota bacterium]
MRVEFTDNQIKWLYKSVDYSIDALPDSGKDFSHFADLHEKLKKLDARVRGNEKGQLLSIY